MAPAATVSKLEAVGIDALVGAQHDMGARRVARNIRRSSALFNTAPSNARLFHAWRP